MFSLMSQPHKQTHKTGDRDPQNPKSTRTSPVPEEPDNSAVVVQPSSAADKSLYFIRVFVKKLYY